MPITGLGPHGERAASPAVLRLSETDANEAASRRFTVAVVLHTTGSDWARQQLAGISSVLGQHGAAIIDVVDCGFDATQQVAALTRLARDNVDAVISIPIGNTLVADAHRAVHAAGKTLVLLDNTPAGLKSGADYACVVSSDNFGLGEMAGKLMTPHVKPGQSVGLLSYAVDFFATNEREIAFRKRMAKERPDVLIRQTKFHSLAEVADVTRQLVREGEPLAALFVVWDEPAILAAMALQEMAAQIPVTTIDLGNAVAINMAKRGLIKGVGAQRPYDQGKAAASATLLALLGRQLPSWVALPGISVTSDNVIEAYQTVWHAPAPAELLKVRRGKK